MKPSQIPTTMAIRMLALTEMKSFTATDWLAFSGCESVDPLIGYIPEEMVILILDGGLLLILNDEAAEQREYRLEVEES
jgi:hypothetical protein